jgi:hypothetical protein
MPTIVGLFDSQIAANAAIHRLRASGLPNEAIGVAVKESSYSHMNDDIAHGNLGAEAATSGAVSGAGVGVLAGLVLAGSTVVIPGVGTFLIGGPLMAVLAGAGVGAATGGLMGALIGLGLPETDAEHFAEGLGQGDIVVSVQADPTRTAIARAILGEEGALRTHEAQGDGAR